MIFGYARVSTSEQNTDLQRDALEGAGVDPKNIFEDRGISGATQDYEIGRASCRERV